MYFHIVFNDLYVYMLHTYEYAHTFERICMLEKCKLASVQMEESAGWFIMAAEKRLRHHTFRDPWTPKFVSPAHEDYQSLWANHHQIHWVKSVALTRGFHSVGVSATWAQTLQCWLSWLFPTVFKHLACADVYGWFHADVCLCLNMLFAGGLIWYQLLHHRWNCELLPTFFFYVAFVLLCFFT